MSATLALLQGITLKSVAVSVQNNEARVEIAIATQHSNNSSYLCTGNVCKSERSIKAEETLRYLDKQEQHGQVGIEDIQGCSVSIGARPM